MCVSHNYSDIWTEYFCRCQNFADQKSVYPEATYAAVYTPMKAPSTARSVNSRAGSK